EELGELLESGFLVGSAELRDDPIDRQEIGDAHAASIQGSSRSQDICRRRDEGKIPMISRYFATVLRAISMLSPANVWAMCWSLYGRRGSSVSLIFLLFSFTDSAETPSPSEERMLEVKKYLSSRVPCGVCTYLLAVARLTVDSCIPMSFATSFRTSGRSAETPFSRNSCWNFTMLEVTM